MGSVENQDEKGDCFSTQWWLRPSFLPASGPRVNLEAFLPTQNTGSDRGVSR